jgi:hypothetical protein
MARFKEFLTSNKVVFTDAEFAENRDWIRDRVRYEMLYRAFDKKTADQAERQIDPEVLKALDSMPKAESLLNESNKAYAMRAAR